MVVSIKFLLEFQRPGDREIEVGRYWPRVKESLPSIGVRTRICFHPIRPPRELYWYSRLVGWKQETRCSFASIRTSFRSLLNFILLFEYFWRVRSSRSGIIDNIRRNLVGEKVSITTNRDFPRSYLELEKPRVQARGNANEKRKWRRKERRKGWPEKEIEAKTT